jgi:aminopeptidase N
MFFPITFGKMILSKRNSLFLIHLLFAVSVFSTPPRLYSKYDYLHGKLNGNRTWFDVTMYDITLKVDPTKKHIAGVNNIYYQVLKGAKLMQLDLQGYIKVDSIKQNNKLLAFTRDSSVILVKMPAQKKKSINQVTVYFSGNPILAKKAPWDGGFVFTKDSSGNDWVGLACQGMGASAWLPCKDHLSDEADSMNMHLQVPEKLTGVSNGRLVGEQLLNNGYKQFDWEVRYPINNYNITVNVANYVSFNDEYVAKIYQVPNPLKLSYYVLPYNLAKAKEHFKQVKVMMGCYERILGTYPFWNDGYKLVETPYWGMEHQSAVSYGNDYNNNRWDFDFIIIHESAHEWFGNSLTANDPADLWIHESFTTYTESLYIECTDSKESALKYLKMQQRNIENKKSLIGDKDVYFHGFTDNDIYYKGSWMLATLRQVVHNDTLWFNTIREYCLTYRFMPLTTDDVVQFFSKRTGKNLKPIFDQYLTFVQLPVFEYQLKEGQNGMLELRYRWSGVVKGFEMPVPVSLTKNGYEQLTAGENWRVVDLNYFDKTSFKVNTDFYLIQVKELKEK